MGKSSQLRHQIALEAARILADQRYLSFAEARTKAAAHLKIHNKNHLPDNLEIEAALREYQSIFLTHRQPEALTRLRQQAINAMQLFSQFHPRLTGDVLSGSADEDSPVQIFLYTDTPEEIIFFLMDQKIPWRETETRLIYPKGRDVRHPGFSFRAGETSIELIALPIDAIKNPPLNQITGRPDKGATLDQVRKLMEEGDQRLEMGV